MKKNEFKIMMEAFDKVKKDKGLARQLAYRAGIITKSGKLKKCYELKG